MGSIFMLSPAVPFAEVADGIQGKAIGAAVGEQDPCLRRMNLLLGDLLPHQQELAGLQLPEPWLWVLLVF